MSNDKELMRLAVGIATRGRPATLKEVLRDLGWQTRPPDRIIVSHVVETDVAGISGAPSGLPPLEFLTGPAGLPHQRNTILDAVADCDVVLFLDDDFIPAPGYIAATLAAFREHPGVVVTTGRVVADGARGPGFSVAAGRAILAQDNADASGPAIAATFNGYGCNMAFRMDVIRDHALRFDERLPLYAWYEDVDLSRRVALYGDVVAIADAAGVHLGVKGGRTSGRRLGYSQVVNPIYLSRKGTYPLGRALHSVARHLLINGARSLRPEPWVDRRGRLSGNGLALLDIMRGRVRPERILDL